MADTGVGEARTALGEKGEEGLLFREASVRPTRGGLATSDWGSWFARTLDATSVAVQPGL